MSTLIKNVPLLDQLVKLIPEDSITGFQLKDLVRKCYSFDELKEALIAKMADKSYMIDPRLAGDEPSEENEKQDKYNARKEAEKEAKMGFPTNDPIEILEQAGCKEFYEWKWKGPKKCGPFAKMKELKIDNETFWGLEEGQYKDILEIKDFGTRKTLIKTVSDIKLAHKRAFEKQEKLDKKLS